MASVAFSASMHPLAIYADTLALYKMADKMADEMAGTEMATTTLAKTHRTIALCSPTMLD